MTNPKQSWTSINNGAPVWKAKYTVNSYFDHFPIDIIFLYKHIKNLLPAVSD